MISIDQLTDTDGLFSLRRILTQPKRMSEATLSLLEDTVLRVGDSNCDDRDRLDFSPRDNATYQILHSGGFLKLADRHGRVYAYAQALLANRVPDWKLHVSVAPDDHEVAWQIIARAFMRHRLRTMMKLQVQGEAWPERQYGREFTIYIYTHNRGFDRLARQELRDDTAREGVVGLEAGVMHRDAEFWRMFIQQLETQLAAANVRSRGTAKGDRALGQYVSLRNEAFVEAREEWQLDRTWHGIDIGAPAGTIHYVYPPNVAGYNGAGHVDPLLHNVEGEEGDRRGCSRAIRWWRTAMRHVGEQVQHTSATCIALVLVAGIVMYHSRLPSQR